MAGPNYSEVKQTVRRLLREYDIQVPPVNPALIAREEGISVREASFSGDFAGVSGFYDPRENAIFVSREEWPLRKTFTIAHELGHAVLHRQWAESADYKVLWRDEARNSNNDPREKEANAFAAHLLVPRNLLNNYYEELSVAALSQLFAVSVPVIRNRLQFEYGI